MSNNFRHAVIIFITFLFSVSASAEVINFNNSGSDGSRGSSGSNGSDGSNGWSGGDGGDLGNTTRCPAYSIWHCR